MSERRVCVFCGNKPENKNNEHVLPRWLIELTGDPKRQISIGPFITQEEPFKKIAFDQLRFPACQECNDRFSTLEEKAKAIVIKLTNRGRVSSCEFDILLDWFDKVRVGLWLGFHQLLDKNYWGITPNFHIDQRIGTADRVLVIYKASQSQRRVNFSGVNTPAFAHMPSCFGLLINDLYFINISYDFLVTKRAGLPYPKSIRWREDEKIEATLPFRDGQERIQFPILDVGNDKRCTVIVQPIFNKYVQLLPHTYETNYIAALTLSSGKAKPLLQKADYATVYPENESLDWLPAEKIDFYDLMYAGLIYTLNTQIMLLKKAHVSSGVRKDKRIAMKFQTTQCIKANELLIAQLKEELSLDDHP